MTDMTCCAGFSNCFKKETRELQTTIKQNVFASMRLGSLEKYKTAFGEFESTKWTKSNMIACILGNTLNVLFIFYSWLYMPERNADQEYNLATIVVRWVEFGVICLFLLQLVVALFLSGFTDKMNFKVGILTTFDKLSWSLFDIITLYDAKVVQTFLQRWWRHARGYLYRVTENDSWIYKGVLTVGTVLIVVPIVGISVLLFLLFPVALLLKLQTLGFVSTKYFIDWGIECLFFFGFLNQIRGVIAKTRQLEYHDYLGSYVEGHSNSAKKMMYWLNETCIGEVGILKALEFVTNVRSSAAFRAFEWTALAKAAPERLWVWGFRHLNGLYEKQPGLRKGCAWYIRETTGSQVQYALAFVKFSGKETGNTPVNSWMFVPVAHISESGQYAEYRAKAVSPSPHLLKSDVWYHHAKEVRVENPIIKIYEPEDPYEERV